MLEMYYSKEAILPFINDYNFFRPISDRAYWEKMREPLEGFIGNAKETYDNYVFEPLYATLFRQFVTEKNRDKFEAKYFDRRRALISYTFVEAIENKGEYIERIMNLVWMILEEATWCLPAHAHQRSSADSLPDPYDPIVDLFAAETATALAFTYTVMKQKLDELSVNICKFLEKEVDRRVLYPAMNDDSFWWSGLNGNKSVNNWNTWINSNLIVSGLAFIRDKEKRAELVARVLRSVDVYINCMPEDGACDEGPSYWTAAGLNVLDIIYYVKNATDGKINLYNNAKIKNIAEYFVKAQIFDGYVTNFADSPAKVRLAASCGKLYRHGIELGSDEMVSLAKKQLDTNCTIDRETGSKKSIVGKSFLNEYTTSYLTTNKVFFFNEYFNMLEYDKPFSYVTDCYLESINYMVSRQSKSSTDGLYLAAKGGHNAENHNHNDVGNFIVYKDGAPFIVDAGSLVYSALTFNPKTRYSLWQNCSNYHNLPTIGGIDQHEGPKFRANDVKYSSDGTRTVFSQDFAAAYDSEDIKMWKRTLDFDKQVGRITVTEEFCFKGEKDIVLNFMSAYPVEEKDGKIIIKAENGAELVMELDIPEYELETEDIFHPEDNNFMKSWDGRLYRFMLKLKDKTAAGKISYTFR